MYCYSHTRVQTVSQMVESTAELSSPLSYNTEMSNSPARHVEIPGVVHLIK